MHNIWVIILWNTALLIWLNDQLESVFVFFQNSFKRWIVEVHLPIMTIFVTFICILSTKRNIYTISAQMTDSGDLSDCSSLEEGATHRLRSEHPCCYCPAKNNNNDPHPYQSIVFKFLIIFVISGLWKFFWGRTLLPASGSFSQSFVIHNLGRNLSYNLVKRFKKQ